ncbi:MAG: efflux RND transporter periplasmic adaptor subunit [Odoribacter sp.]|nr:efflux RND transporter periplasmic adaptor subunit [Odoribacter sp.]
MIKRHFFSCVWVVCSLLMCACSGKETKEEVNQETVYSRFAGKVKTAKSTLSSQEREATLSGKVSTDPDKTISYTPLISGRVERIYFSLGDKVTKGQVLMDLRSPELSSLEAELKVLQAELKVAEREQQTAQSLYENGMISETEWLEAQGNVLQITANLEKIKTDMAFFGTSQGNGVFALKAPSSGYIIDKNVASGNTVSADSGPLFTIANLNTVWVMVNIYASDLMSVKEGMEVELTTVSYPGQVFKGKIDNISQVFDPEDKVLKGRVIMPNTDLKLKPEMSVVVKLKDKMLTQQVCIPSDALIFDNDSYYVVVEQGKNEYAITKVTPAGHHHNFTYLASGLDESKDVVVENQLLIYSEIKGK